MLISIITVAFNSEKTISKTIDSIVAQSSNNYEYIVIDGGSTDRTIDIIKEKKKKLKGRVVIISEKDDGIYYAMNKGLNLAKGDIIGILNSDDWYEKSTIEHVIDFFSKNKEIDVVIGNVNKCNENCKKISISRNRPLDQARKLMPVNHPAMFVKKEIYDRYGGFNTDYKVAADYELVCRLINKKVRIEYSDDVYTNFRMGGCTNSYNRLKGVISANNGVWESRKIQKKYFDNSYNIIYLCAVTKIIIKYLCSKIGINYSKI